MALVSNCSWLHGLRRDLTSTRRILKIHNLRPVYSGISFELANQEDAHAGRGMNFVNLSFVASS